MCCDPPRLPGVRQPQTVCSLTYAHFSFALRFLPPALAQAAAGDPAPQIVDSIQDFTDDFLRPTSLDERRERRQRRQNGEEVGGRQEWVATKRTGAAASKRRRGKQTRGYASAAAAAATTATGNHVDGLRRSGGAADGGMRGRLWGGAPLFRHSEVGGGRFSSADGLASVAAERAAAVARVAVPIDYDVAAADGL